jgi:phosphoketolase
LDHLFRGYGYTPYFVEGNKPEAMHELMAATLDKVVSEIQRIKADARVNGSAERPRWPMIVFRTPKGWTCTKEIDGKRGDGEAETGPLATNWHSNKFLNPATDGVVLPILHLNGYKIANPCILARISQLAPLHRQIDGVIARDLEEHPGVRTALVSPSGRVQKARPEFETRGDALDSAR